ncbi:hypothetical protein ACE6H2_001588 [Prunus campanulata]
MLGLMRCGPHQLGKYRERVGGLPPAQDADVKSLRNRVATSWANDVSPLRKKLMLPYTEKIQVGAVPSSSARVKHPTSADNRKVGGMRNARDVLLKPPTDKLGNSDLLREVVCSRISSPV